MAAQPQRDTVRFGESVPALHAPRVSFIPELGQVIAAVGGCAERNLEILHRKWRLKPVRTDLCHRNFIAKGSLQIGAGLNIDHGQLMWMLTLKLVEVSDRLVAGGMILPGVKSNDNHGSIPNLSKYLSNNSGESWPRCTAWMAPDESMKYVVGRPTICILSLTSVSASSQMGKVISYLSRNGSTTAASSPELTPMNRTWGYFSA